MAVGAEETEAEEAEGLLCASTALESCSYCDLAIPDVFQCDHVWPAQHGGITALPNLRQVESRPDHWWIPCLATWTDLIETPLPPAFDALKLAASQVGGRQIQNAGTVVGNVCNASPAADGIP
ncbi:MAG: FAD binding domain-containing protein, partial [Gemmatimonadales bacterium]